jgi:hypothetical protein
MVLSEFQPSGPEPGLVWRAPERTADGVAEVVAGESHRAVVREPAIHHKDRDGPSRVFTPGETAVDPT